VCKTQLIFKWMLLFSVSCRFSVSSEWRKCMFHARRFYVVCDFVLLEMIRYKYQVNSQDRTSPQVSFTSSDMIYLSETSAYIWI
jgi:hypothetical protein